MLCDDDDLVEIEGESHKGLRKCVRCKETSRLDKGIDVHGS